MKQRIEQTIESPPEGKLTMKLKVVMFNGVTEPTGLYRILFMIEDVLFEEIGWE